MLCRHCCRRAANRPRRLCAGCYLKPHVREKYAPKISRAFCPGHGLEEHARVHLPPFPTDALPGTPAKVAVLQQRARLRQELFHPQDATEYYTPFLEEAG